MPERPVAHRTLSDIAPEPLYTPEDIGVLDPEYEEKRGYPGEYPYTRGVYGSMYRSKLWTMRMFAGFGTAEQTNERFKKLLKAGQTGLSVAFDLPTLMGYDSDHPLAKGEVGKCGVAVSSLADMEILFEGINLEEVTTSMTINSPANAIWAMYLAVAKKKGYDWKKLGGTIQNDILKEFIAQKEFIFPPRAQREAGHRHLRVGAQERPQVELHLRLRLPHPGGGLHGGAGARLDPGGRL